MTFLPRAAVRVPASSANLGPGFDSYGLALSLYDDLAAEVTDSGLTIDIAGEGAATIARNESHLVYRSMGRFFEEIGHRPAGLRLRCDNRIPHGRGLGSSAAAIVGGLALARALVPDVSVDDQRLLELADEIEGHPDNVAAAMAGGFTVAWTDRGAVHPVGAVRLEPHPDLQAVLIVPPSGLSTKRARAALPESVPHCDAAMNVARAGLLVEALTRRPEFLLQATHDRLHQEQRRASYPETYQMVEILRANQLAAVVSGAGPTVLVLGTEPMLDKVRALAGADRDVRDCALDRTGVTVLPAGVLG